MPLILQTKLTSFECVPEHMAQLSIIAKEQGLNRSALLRQIVAKYVRRAERQK
jgi:predicted transcriptional regulator